MSTNFVSFGLPQADTSPVYADGKDLTEINRVLSINDQRIAGLRHRPEERFWSTPPRYIGDRNRDVIEIDLSVPKRVNHLTFDLVHFPHLCLIEYWNDDTQTWVPMQEASGRPTYIKTLDSRPALLITEHTPMGHQHPQHHGPGHWVPYDIEVSPVMTSRVRWICVRSEPGTPPLDHRNQPVAYSLGLRNVDIGYIVRDKKTHVPVSGSITTATDLFGSSVTYDLKQNLASDLMIGQGVWRSEPQPVSYAVVCFYLNALGEDGEGQVIDRFFLDPLHSGGNVNIYYSNDTPTGTFEARDTPLIAPAARLGGSDTPTFDSTAGATFPADGGYVSIDNRYLAWLIDKPWWMGLVITPDFDPSDAITRTIISASQITLSVSHGVFTLATQNPNTSMSVPVQFTMNEQMRVFVSYDGTTLSLDVDTGFTLVSATEQVTITTPPEPDDIRIGGDHSTQGGSGAFRLSTMVLKQEMPPTYQWAIANYFAASFGFNTKGEFVSDFDRSTDNALVRFDPLFITDSNPHGFLGGEGDRYASLVWSPIQRDFKLRKGYYYIPPTKARFYKFEFSNLTPEPYELIEPVYRVIDTFPPDLTIRFQNFINRPVQSAGTGSSGADVNAALFTFNQQPDAAQTPIFLTNPVNEARGYTPTEVLLATDPSTAQRIQDLSYLYRFQNHRGSHHIPRWPYPSVHRYQRVEVLHDQRVAYFVGLKQVVAYRLSYSATDDTPMYLELFQDLHNVEQTTLLWDDAELLHTANDSPVQATGIVFGSRRAVRGVQVATTQSPPKQLLPDPDFDDPLLAHWTAYGDATISPSNEFNTFIGTTALVARAGSIETGGQNVWHDIELNFADYDAIEQSGASWDSLAGQPGLQSAGGVQSVESYRPAPFGRMYVAARVIAQDALREPLWAQVVDTSGNILAEQEVTVPAGEVVEWFAGYTIGSALTGEHYQTWDQVTSKNDPNPTTYDFLQEFTWDEVSSSAEQLLTDVRVRLIQKGKAADKWFVDNLSLFQDTIIWEFSNDGGTNFFPVFDIRNDPHGVFLFPDIPAGEAAEHEGNELVWRVKAADTNVHISSLAIRPWYAGMLADAPAHESINVSTPNQAQYDHYMPIENDPRWMMWSKPIPEEWWYFFRQYLLLPKSDITLLPPKGVGVYLGDPLELTTGSTQSDVIVLSEDLIVSDNSSAGGGSIVLPEDLVVPFVSAGSSTTVLSDDLIVVSSGSTTVLPETIIVP